MNARSEITEGNFKYEECVIICELITKFTIKITNLNLNAVFIPFFIIVFYSTHVTVMVAAEGCFLH